MHRGKVDLGVSELPRGNELSRDHVNRPLDVIPETEYGTPINIYDSLDNTKKGNFKTFILNDFCTGEAEPIKIAAAKNL